MRIRPTFSITNKRPEPSACRSTGRCRPETTGCQAYALGSGNVDAPEGVFVGGICVDVGVSGIGVGEAGVGVTGSVVGVPEGGGGVLVSLHAKSVNTSKSSSRFI